MKKNIFLLGMALVTSLCGAEQRVPMYICTAAGSNYFPYLMNLIGSLFRVNFDDLEELAVFNVGLTSKQCATLKTIQKVAVYDVELTHPDLLKPVRVNKSGKKVPGWYAWKPVIMKQALDMFPYVLYMDAGTTVLNPLNDLFHHIIQNDYFLTDCGHDIAWMTTRYVVDQFDLMNEQNQWILAPTTRGVAGSPQGLTHAVYNNYINPMYQLTKTLRSFVDDGTTPNGFGTGRHDQALFSVVARLQNLNVHVQDGGDGRMIELTVDGKPVQTHITWNPKQVNNKTIIYCHRNNIRGNKLNKFKQFIRYKK